MSRWLVFLAVAIVALAAQQTALADHAPPLTPVDPEACDAGTIVADPANNTELVADCKVLAGLKSTIEGTSDNVKRRLQWDDSTSLSEWEGISVGGSPRRVTVIKLDSSSGTPMPPPRLRGEVPAELGSLTGLVTINLHWNYLSGVIPPELGDLPNLETLILSSNSLSNPWNNDDPRNRYEEPGIPSELGKLKDTLQYLDLSGNSLGGDIPSDIWDLTELLSLRLYGNELTGTIPAEIKDLTKLQALSLHLNNLSGNIPSEITQLSELMTLALYGNGFTGTLPPGLGSLPLTDVDLRDNLLTGSFPSELENLLPGLQRLNLGGNAWTGCVPPPLLDVQTTDLDFMIENYDLYGLILCGSSTNSNTPPSLDLAEVDADTLTLTYNEALDETSQPATEDYTVTVDSVDRGVTAVDVSGSTVTLTLAPAVVASDTVKVSYTRRTNPVQDSDGARAGEFTDELVTNNTTPAPPVYVPLSGVVNGDTLTLTYDEALDPDSEPATTTYTVTAGSTTHTVSDVEISGMTVTLMLSTPVQALQTVLLSYLPGSNPLQDLDGEDAAPLTNITIANETDVPPRPPRLSRPRSTAPHSH